MNNIWLYHIYIYHYIYIFILIACLSDLQWWNIVLGWNRWLHCCPRMPDQWRLRRLRSVPVFLEKPEIIRNPKWFFWECNTNDHFKGTSTFCEVFWYLKHAFLVCGLISRALQEIETIFATSPLQIIKRIISCSTIPTTSWWWLGLHRRFIWLSLGSSAFAIGNAYDFKIPIWIYLRSMP